MASHYPVVPASADFPSAEVEACIRESLKAAHATQEILRSQEGSACEPEIDSLVVIEVVCAIEELLGVTLPTSFAPRGGYESVEECVSELVSQTHAAWTEVVKPEVHHA